MQTVWIDQARQNVGPALDPSCLTLMVFLKEFSKKVDLKKKNQKIKILKKKKIKKVDFEEKEIKKVDFEERKKSKR